MKLLNLFVLAGGTWTIVDYKFWRRFEIDDDIYKKVMDMIVKEQKRRKQENIRNLLLIGYKKDQNYIKMNYKKLLFFFKTNIQTKMYEAR